MHWRLVKFRKLYSDAAGVLLRLCYINESPDLPIMEGTVPGAYGHRHFEKLYSGH